MVVKRDGSKVEFDKNKIISAIKKAGASVENFDVDNWPLPKTIADYIELTYLCNSDSVIFDIEQIQEMVIRELMTRSKTAKEFKVVENYITYRYKHSVARNQYAEFMDAISEKLNANNVENQNANVDERSFGGRIGEANRVMMKRFALDNILSDMARYNHENNRIHIHDFDNYAIGNHNCLSIPFDDLLANGFNTRQSDVRPAQSVSTAMQLVAVIFQLQSLQQFGGVSATHLDWTMVPYVRKSFFKHWKNGLKYIYNIDYTKYKDVITDAEPIDSVSYKDIMPLFGKAYDYAMDMTKKEIYQSAEALYHNLNTLQSRSGNQLPFTSINYGTCTLPEGRMVTEAILNVSLAGNGAKHKTSIFPCGIFQVGEGINKRPGDPNYDLFRLALKSTARRLYPNYANIDWSGNAGYDKNDPRTYFSTMGCRTANGMDINGLGQLKDGRGNICPVTIILPTIAMEAYQEVINTSYEDKDYPKDLLESKVVRRFFKKLEDAIYDAKEMLIERFDYICSQDPASAKFMYENNLMAGYIPKEGIRSALKHGTLVIGQLGLAECLQILIKCDHTTEKGMELAKDIERLFEDRCAMFKKRYKLNFGVYYTPAENLCYTALTRFREKYGVIPNVSDRDYFTNSMHVPVWHKMTAYEKINIESQLTGFSNAGCITYIELDGNAQNNIDALEKIVVYAMDKDIPYFAINVPNDHCLDCGNIDQIDDVCPICGSKHIQRLRRITGYLTGDYKTAFNYGKQKEVEDREKHGYEIESVN